MSPFNSSFTDEIDLANGRDGWNGGYASFLVLLFIVAKILEIKMWMKK